MPIDFSKRYWLFEWNDYYPLGALDNVTDSTDDLSKATIWASGKNDFDQRKVWDNNNYCFLPEKTNDREINDRLDLLEEKVHAVMDAFQAVNWAQITTLLSSIDQRVLDANQRATAAIVKCTQLASTVEQLVNNNQQHD